MFKIRVKPPTAGGQAVSSPSPAPATISAPSPSTPTGGLKFKIKQPRQQKLRVKAPESASKIVLRKSYVGGYGYDSEASDKEDDPTIENHIILRFKSGSEADFLRKKIDAKEGMEGISIKFKDSRNAVVIVQKKLFAAKLVDLPTITEVHKSFDKKNIYKVADICQMLLVGDRISHEDTVLAIPTQPKDFIYPHGLTPPLRNVRTRRFRKRASAKTIESVEREVDRLFSLDANSEQMTYTIMDKEELEREQRSTSEVRASSEPEDYPEDEEMEDGSDYDDLAADLEAQLNSPEVSNTGTPVATRPAVTANPSQAPSPAAEPSPLASPHASEGSDDGSDVGSDEDEDVARDQALKKTGQRALREDVGKLQQIIAGKKADIEKAKNPIMKQRLYATLRKLESELEMKAAELEEAEASMAAAAATS